MKPQHRPRGTGPVAALRVKAGLSQRQLAEQAGLTVPYLGSIEAGRAATTLERAQVLALRCGCPPIAYLEALIAVRTKNGRRRRATRANGKGRKPYQQHTYQGATDRH